MLKYLVLISILAAVGNAQAAAKRVTPQQAMVAFCVVDGKCSRVPNDDKLACYATQADCDAARVNVKAARRPKK